MKYRYTGPLTAVTLPGVGSRTLSPGAEVELPAENSYVRSLVARQHLFELPADVSPAPAKPQARPTNEKESS